MDKMYDSIVIGGGPAGIAAAIYISRKKLETLIITQEFGGQAAKSSEIENYLGFPKISGPELMQKFVEHLDALGIEKREGETVKQVKKTDQGFEVKTDGAIYQTKSVLVASGKVPRSLNIPGEEEFKGKGISYCAICDGPLFGQKNVTVIGGGNSALDAALEMEKYAAKVYILNLNKDFQGDEIRKDRIKESNKIEVLNEVETVEFVGENFLKGIKYKTKTGEIKEVATDGAFIEIGWTPATEIISSLVALNEIKEVKIDLENRTNVPGLFAAGDVTDIAEKQIIIAAGEGAKAGLNVWRYLVLEHGKK